MKIYIIYKISTKDVFNKLRRWKKGVDTLDAFSYQALDYIEDIYEHYFSKTGNEGSWWGDIEISTEFSEESDSFDAILSIGYYIDDYYENGNSFNTNELYALTFDLNDDNKFDITEKYSYKNIKSVRHDSNLRPSAPKHLTPIVSH